MGQGPDKCETGRSVRFDLPVMCMASEGLYTYYRLPVTILLEEIICWPLNRGQKAVNNNLGTAK